MSLINSLLHIDKELITLASNYGSIIYPILFCIIFIETGLVIMPFLPGDSLLFAAGILSSQGILNLFLVIVVLFFAAVIGDSINYSIGKYFGYKLATSKRVNQDYLDKTRQFYERYGGKAVILARFIPIIRTFVPFVAGIGAMNYSKFIAYNLIGGFLWVTILTLAGYFFGAIPLVKNNLGLVTLGIIILSIIPLIVEFINLKFINKK